MVFNEAVLGFEDQEWQECPTTIQEFEKEVQGQRDEADQEDEAESDGDSDSEYTDAHDSGEESQDYEESQVSGPPLRDSGSREESGTGGSQVTGSDPIDRRITRSMGSNLKAFVVSNCAEEEPKTFEEAQSDGAWVKAMEVELESLKSRRTWELVELPKGMRKIGSKWVYRIKTDAYGNEVKKKARLVIQGYRQKEGIDYEETFAPVVRLESLRILLALKAIHGWKSFQLDVKTAFLYGTIDKDIYMDQPEGFVEKGKEHFVCHLLKSLYGLKQAPRIWNE